jgi:hypothetical protein
MSATQMNARAIGTLAFLVGFKHTAQAQKLPVDFARLGEVDWPVVADWFTKNAAALLPLVQGKSSDPGTLSRLEGEARAILGDVFTG